MIAWPVPAPIVVEAHARSSHEDAGDRGHGAEDGGGAAGPPDTWERELRRWLATLNPGRTQREYEKAVGYFFGTPGVPQALEELTFDLLLAYRGALALRATAHDELGARPRRGTGQRLGPADRARLAPGPRDDGDEAAATGTYDDATSGGQTPRRLAPATVNLRLTALRQFLVHCALIGSLPQLSPDRVRAALKRLSIERRRPYQVLAEPEWREFLAAARLPLAGAPIARGIAEDLASQSPRPALAPGAKSPWGVPRAVRQQRVQQTSRSSEAAGASSTAAGGDVEEASVRLPRSKAGLTGARTAQRDHALIALALATGLRAIELASLDVGDLSREWHAGRQEWWLILPDKKTKGQRGGRLLPLDPELVETMLAYLAATERRWESAADRATPLFIAGPARPSGTARRAKRSGDSGGLGRGKRRAPRRLSPNQIRRIVDRVETQWLALRARAAGVSGEEGEEIEAGESVGETRAISPHALRHSTAIALLEGNDAAGRPPASVEHVRGWLGHFDIRTTQGYLAHLEGRKHRRPFTLTPGSGSRAQPPSEDDHEMGPAE
jgi:integrase